MILPRWITGYYMWEEACEDWYPEVELYHHREEEGHVSLVEESHDAPVSPGLCLGNFGKVGP